MEDLRIGVLTCSDSRAAGEADDEAGRGVIDSCEQRDWVVVSYHVCPHELEAICTSIIEMTDVEEVHVVLTLGGTGLGPRDVTPEATELVCERMAPGIAEALRCVARDDHDAFVLSRATAGIRGSSLVINLPGGTGPTAVALEALAPHIPQAVAMVTGAQ